MSGQTSVEYKSKKAILAMGSREAGVIIQVSLEEEPGKCVHLNVWMEKIPERQGWMDWHMSLPYPHMLVLFPCPQQELEATRIPLHSHLIWSQTLQSVHSGSACEQGPSTMCQE